MQEKVERQCPVCCTGYLADPTRLRHGRQTTCSRACSYALRASEKQTSVTLVCAVCEREFTRQPAKIKGQHGAQFCSRECHYLGRATGDSLRVITQPYRYTDDARARQSEVSARAYADGRTAGLPQSERLVSGVLAGLREPFTYQHLIRGQRRAFAVDFYLPRHRLVIELDGPEHRHKARVRHRDAELDAELAALDIRVEHITLGTPEDVRSAVLRALGA